jgi:hypothetical protein
VGGMCPHCVSPPPPMPTLPTKNTRMLPHFRLSIAPAPVTVAAELSTQTAPLQLCLNLGIGCQASGPWEAPAKHGDTHPPDSADTPATSHKVGSFIYDKERGIYPLQWEDLSSFHAWHREEELAHLVELIASSTVSGGRLWLQKRIFVCVCQLSGGPNKYKKKFSHFRKIGTKKTGCHCQIIIKRYHHTPTVLGRYVNVHNHDLGLGNITYMCLSRGARETVKAMLIQQVDRRAIVCNYVNITYF